MRQAQHAYETAGLLGLAATAAGNIPMAVIMWDSIDQPEAASAIKDSTLLAQSARDPKLAVLMRVFDGLLQVVGGHRDAYPLCLDAFAELNATGGGWLAEWGAMCLGLAAELVGNQPVATSHALRWIRYCRRSGVRLMLPCGIRGAARLSASAGYPAEALRLWGSAGHVEAITGLQYLPLMQRLDRPLLQQCNDALGPDAARLVAEGASWSVAEATQAAEDALVRLQAKNDETQYE
jgi:hypothetical protein